MADPAVMVALPGLLQAARDSVEAHAPVYGPTMALRCALLALLEGAVFAAEQFVALTPLPKADPHGSPQQVHAAAGAGRPPVVEPCVPRRDGALPPGRYHP